MRPTPRGDRMQAGQAVVELALVVPLLLFLAFGVVGVGRITQAHMAVSAVATDAALAAARASSPGEALSMGMERGSVVAHGYGLSDGALHLTVDAGAFGRGGQVRATARYTVTLRDLPLLGWAEPTVQSTAVAPVDAYSGVTSGHR